MCEVWTASNTLIQKTAHGTFNGTKGRILPALQPGQETEGADGKEIGCADSRPQSYSPAVMGSYYTAL